MRRYTTLVVLLLLAACFPLSVSAAAPAHAAAPTATASAKEPAGWVGTWSAAANGGVTDSGYAGYTIRNLVHTSLGGQRIRVKLSNAFGTKPVRFAHTTVGLQRLPGSAAIATGTLRDVTFGGSTAVTVPAGEELYSDPVELPLSGAADLFVTTFTPDPSGPVTYHDLGLATSYYATDGTDHAADLGAGGLPLTTTAWHYVTEVDVEPGAGRAAAVVTLGDSITDGFQSTPGANRRWPDLLAARLRAAHGPASTFGVLNAGISGNRVLLDGAAFLFNNEYEKGLIETKTGWSGAEILDRVGTRVTTLGAHGVRIERKGRPDIEVHCPEEDAKVDPTGVGDAFRAGFLSGLSWGVDLERAAQVGNMLATLVIETLGTQEYELRRGHFMERFTKAYGDAAAAEVQQHLGR
ncbi:PfkB family carbohydrate kinase [Actinacidiphila rubida]|uniref:PfkB family carbohydrate kinase n=1 Tax=Actinacidiphila rubida TaxID=310780 RepID=UPI000B322C2D|nr:PfkB family carbohydrate kinase [Actinacidiphila rubida]